MTIKLFLHSVSFGAENLIWPILRGMFLAMSNPWLLVWDVHMQGLIGPLKVTFFIFLYGPEVALF